MTASANPNRVAMRRYTVRLMSVMTIYVLALVGGQLAMQQGLLPDAAAFPVALVCGLCVASVFLIIGALIVDMKDEFLRMLMVRQTLIATGIALGAAAMHGFLTAFDVVPRLDAFWWPMAFFAGLFVGQIANRITYGTWGVWLK